jgi:hypothetical protein
MKLRKRFFGRIASWLIPHQLEEDLAATKSALHDTEQQLAAALRQLKYCVAQNDRFAEALGKLVENYWEEQKP